MLSYAFFKKIKNNYAVSTYVMLSVHKELLLAEFALKLSVDITI